MACNILHRAARRSPHSCGCIPSCRQDLGRPTLKERWSSLNPCQQSSHAAAVITTIHGMRCFKQAKNWPLSSCRAVRCSLGWRAPAMPRVMSWGLMLTCHGSRSRLWRSGVCSTGSHSATAPLRYRCDVWMALLALCCAAAAVSAVSPEPFEA